MIRAEHEEDLVVRLEDGEDVPAALLRLGCDAALIHGGIGMVRNARLAYWNGTAYEEHVIDEPCELVSMQGNIARGDGDIPIIHCHVALARRDSIVVGGHLVAATAHNTVEIGLRRLSGIRLSRRPEPNGLIGLYPTSS